MPDNLTWGDPGLELSFGWSTDEPVCITRIARSGRDRGLAPISLVDVLTVAHGRMPASGRLAFTELGSMLRYMGHRFGTEAGRRWLTIQQEGGGVAAEIRLEQLIDAPSAIRATTMIRAIDSVVLLRAVTSMQLGFTSTVDGNAASDPLGGWRLTSGRSDWLGEGRFVTTTLRDSFPPLEADLTDSDPRAAIVSTSDGTWSTGGDLPTGTLSSDSLQCAVMWQIEHNGAWRWEIGEHSRGAYLSLAGPTDVDSAWLMRLAPGEEFVTVPVAISIGDDTTDAAGAMTLYRRAARRTRRDNDAMPVVFNDYMNTLNGDPTTEKLLPLIAAAGEIGAEIFCIDAGWYDDSGHWWDSVGEWKPSTTRFPNGLGEVIDAIRDAGMTPGLWLEPEVIGVRSTIAATLPDEAFLSRHGQRIVEHHRHHLDLRHPAAVAHLNATVDGLIAEFGIGFFKFDYNINPGPGTDHASDSVGDGLLQHNRAHLAWLDDLLDRHPDLVIENCASGAMRMDFAMLSRLSMQSTSDQQHVRRFPAIAAAAPISMLPEQAANWAYPQPGMGPEEFAFALTTGMLGRFYLSGHLEHMTAAQRREVARAVTVAKRLRHEVRTKTPFWPLGLPGWEDSFIALGLSDAEGALVTVWGRGEDDTTELFLPQLRGHDVAISVVYPTGLAEWQTQWDAASGRLLVHTTTAPLTARVLRVRSTSPSSV